MSQGTLRVLARLVARPGKEEALRSLLMGLIAPTRKESGCVTYELLQNKETSAEFTFVQAFPGTGYTNLGLALTERKYAIR